MSDNPKYYTAFLFDPEMRDGLHCTHCYFGTLSGIDLARVTEDIILFFRFSRHVSMEQPVFDRRAHFGPNEDINVLVCSNPEVFLEMTPLRLHFVTHGFLHTSEKYPFTPHVTTEETTISKPVVRYALIRSGRVLFSWPINSREL